VISPSVWAGVGLLVVAAGARAGPVWFENDYEGWAAAATAAGGIVQTIDFETLPDGRPSIAGTRITPDFNYTAQGVTFASPVNLPFIEGNVVSTFGLGVDSSPSLDRNWIIADLVQPASAVGVVHPAGTILSIFDEDGNLLGRRLFGVPGPFFFGVISDIAIALSTSDRGGSGEGIGDYSFVAIPDVSTGILLLVGAAAAIARRTYGGTTCKKHNSRSLLLVGRSFCGCAGLLLLTATARAGPVWFENDYEGWAAAVAGPIHTIDFETLPDGSPSVASTPITTEFNYTAQGITFAGPVNDPFIAGNTVTGFGLRVSSSPNLRSRRKPIWDSHGRHNRTRLCRRRVGCSHRGHDF